MSDWNFSILEALLAAGKKAEETDAKEYFAIGALALVLLFFLWLVWAVVRKKLGTSKKRIGEVKEDEAEAARTARLWAEAKRKTEEEEEEEEEEEQELEPDDHGDMQAELVEKAQKRREERRAQEAAARTARQEALRASEGQPEQESPKAEPPKAEPPKAEQPKAEQPKAEQPKAEQPREEPPREEPPREEPPKEEPPKEEPPKEEPPAEPKSLEEGLKKTRTGFVARLTSMFSGKDLDEDQIEELEEILFTADIGVRTAQKLLDFIENEMESKDRSDPGKMLSALKDKISSMLSTKAPALDMDKAKPFVILVVGVNGTGKTTTIGKLALRYTQAGKKVILAAGDTFRAAAAEQLQIWGERTGSQVIRGQEGGDPGAIIYDAVSAAKSQGADLVIADTAGRLHTKINLVEELRKVHRVCGKALEGAPHEVWLVLDATTGQNAISQAKQFHKALDVSGIVLTKLDGTAKGGVIIGITDTYSIPVRFIGIGEQANDLRPFDPDAFVKALFT